MRRVRLSQTFADALQAQLRYGAGRFGIRVSEEKRARVDRTIFETLRTNPGIGQHEDDLKLMCSR